MGRERRKMLDGVLKNGTKSQQVEKTLIMDNLAMNLPSRDFVFFSPLLVLCNNEKIKS